MSAPDERIEAAFAAVASEGVERIAPPHMLRTRDVLELSGEALRRLLCTFPDDSGVEYSMRPDMTTPIAMMVARKQVAAARYCYCGDVFRLSENDAGSPVSFAQVGFEWFDGGGVAEDAAALAQTAAMLSATGARSASIAIGDVGVFQAVVDSLGFSPLWSSRLKRSFSRLRGPEALIERHRLSAAAPELSMLGKGLAGLNDIEAVRAAEELFALAGVQVIGGRTVEDIAARIRSRADERTPDDRQIGALLSYLEHSSGAGESVGAICKWARSASLQLDDSLDKLRDRLKEIDALGPPFWSSAQFSARAGGRFEYYDGFAFEFRLENASSAVVAGGRYDGLVGRLRKDAVTMPAIGAALRADRLSPEGAVA